ncbi:MAG TPA: M48 family metalloprotease [Burkholderiales bacterium]|jgi:predicted Zn-dependent protease|nr:M48 family metalloprotease [Burkholderiales bacterium]
MRLLAFFAALLVAAGMAPASDLPDLGEISQAGFSPAQERALGESIMREIRADPSYLDEPEATDYINSVGNRIASRAPGAHQEFEFFLIQDQQINAFALPGGFIGINTGLLLAAQSESEMAGVIAHEIAHVAQRHIARMLAKQEQNQLLSLAALAAAILLARVDSQVGQAAGLFGQAGVMQSQLNFTRDNEREADRIGLQILEKANFDPRGMAVFFERLQRATRIYGAGAPSYLRTHPLEYERIADIQGRIADLPYRQVPDSVEFQLVRAKLKAQLESPQDAVAFFRESLAERKYLSEAASRYGLATSLARTRDYPAAKKELTALRRLVPSSPIVETLACDLSQEAGEPNALACYREALKTYPTYRALLYGYADALLQERNARGALQLVDERLKLVRGDRRLYLLKARAHADLNQRLAQHSAQAEAYVLMGNLGAAVDQLEIGLKSGDGDFYQKSSAEARLRELRRVLQEQRRQEKK